MRVVHAHHLFPDVGQTKAKEIHHLQTCQGALVSAHSSISAPFHLKHHLGNSRTLSPLHRLGALQAPAQQDSRYQPCPRHQPAHDPFLLPFGAKSGQGNRVQHAPAMQDPVNLTKRCKAQTGHLCPALTCSPWVLVTFRYCPACSLTARPLPPGTFSSSPAGCRLLGTSTCSQPRCMSSNCRGARCGRVPGGEGALCSWQICACSAEQKFRGNQQVVWMA